MRSTTAVACSRAVSNPKVGMPRSGVVVDGLRHVRDADAPRGLLGDAARRVGGVVAADRDQVIDAELLEGRNHAREVLGLLRRVRARGLEDRAAEQVDARDQRDAQLGAVASISLHQPREAVQQPEHARARAPRQDGGRTDHAIDARRRPATDQHAEGRHRTSQKRKLLLGLFHPFEAHNHWPAGDGHCVAVAGGVHVEGGLGALCGP
jgi:hypothetical protein